MKEIIFTLKLSAYKFLILFLIACLFLPEILTVGSYISPKRFEWWKDMIEDNDKSPNHKDGVFMVTMWGAIWSLRAALYCTYKGNEVLTGEWIAAFCVLLGIRSAFPNKKNIISSITEKITDHGKEIESKTSETKGSGS